MSCVFASQMLLNRQVALCTQALFSAALLFSALYVAILPPWPQARFFFLNTPRAHTHTQTHTNSQNLSLTLTHTHTHAHAHTHTHIHTFSLALALPHPCSPALSLAGRARARIHSKRVESRESSCRGSVKTPTPKT